MLYIMFSVVICLYIVSKVFMCQPRSPNSSHSLITSAQSLQSSATWVVCLTEAQRLTLCDLTDCSPPGSSVHGILQAGTVEWVAMTSSRGSSRPRDQTHIAGGFFISEPEGEAPRWFLITYKSCLQSPSSWLGTHGVTPVGSRVLPLTGDLGPCEWM